MKLSFGLRRFHAAAALFAAACYPLLGSTIILDEFTRTSPGENVTSLFTNPSTSTAGSYSGYVEVLVSGTGYSLWSLINDAFHGVPGGSPLDSQYYQLNLGWTSAPLVPLSGEPRNITNFIVFVEGVGSVAPGYTPAYESVTHTYHFVVDTGLLSAQQLQFGVSDGNFGDNGGAYDISVWQLEKGVSSVPESPAPYTLFGLSFLCLLARWRQRT